MHFKWASPHMQNNAFCRIYYFDPLSKCFEIFVCFPTKINLSDSETFAQTAQWTVKKFCILHSSNLKMTNFDNFLPGCTCYITGIMFIKNPFS